MKLRAGIVIVTMTMAMAVTESVAYAQRLQLTWVDRTGSPIEIVGTPETYRGLDVSPDGRRVAVHRHDGVDGDIWLFDSTSALARRITGDGTSTQENAMPIWSPDGSRVVYGSVRNGRGGLYLKRADGTGPEELLFESETTKTPMSWSRDGQYIVYWTSGGIQWVLPLSGDRAPFELVQDGGSTHAQISPDGRWVAYSETGTGRQEIYIKPFPTGSGKWRVSRSGGGRARWRADGRELFFMDSTMPSPQMMAAEIRVNGSAIEAGEPRKLFDTGYVNFGDPGGNHHPYAVSPDGQRLLVLRPEPGVSSNAPNSQTLTVFDRGGNIVSTIGERGLFTLPSFSPDRTRVAVIKADLLKGTRDIWVVDAATGKASQITTSLAQESPWTPIWSPDGTQIAYVASRGGNWAIYRKPSNGFGSEEVLVRLTGAGIDLADWSADGRYLIYYSEQLGGNILFGLGLGGTPTSVEIARSDFQMRGARLSPDGRFLAYRSNESGRNEIWVRPFDPSGRGAGGKWQVSAEGGAGLVSWRGDSRELYYVAPDRGLMAVGIRNASGFEFDKARLMFAAPFPSPVTNSPEMVASLSRDGERMLFAVPPSPPLPPPLQQMKVFDRDGKVLQVLGDAGMYSEPAFSPDGSRIAVRKMNVAANTIDIWSYDLATGTGRVVASTATFGGVLWSPDGNQLLFVSNRPGGYRVIIRKNWDGSGAEELLFRHTAGAPLNLNDVSPDGNFVTFDSGGVIFVVPMTGSDPLARQPIEFLREEYNTTGGRFSPDGRFIAYTSSETNRNEVWVQPFDAVLGTGSIESRKRVTRNSGGNVTAWRGDGRELYFRKNDQSDFLLMAIDVAAPASQQGTPTFLFRIPNNQGVSKNVSRDGQRFVFVMPVTATPAR